MATSLVVTNKPPSPERDVKDAAYAGRVHDVRDQLPATVVRIMEVSHLTTARGAIRVAKAAWNAPPCSPRRTATPRR